jgi:ribonuclease VapC
MILDTSALVAVLYGEPEARDFVERIRAADVCRISVANHVELSMVVESQLGPNGTRQADAFLHARASSSSPSPSSRATWPGRLFSTSAKAGTRRV